MANPKLPYGELKEYYKIHRNKHGDDSVAYGTFLKRYNVRGWSLKDAIKVPSIQHSTRDKYRAEKIREAEYLENFIPQMYYAKTYSQKLPKEKKNYYNFKPKKTLREKIKERFHKYF